MQNQSNSNTEIIVSKKVLEMITVANEYCLFVEKINHYEKNEVMLYLSRIAPLLYIKGSLLPDIEVTDTDANERFVTEEQWLSIYKETKELFKKDNSYSDNYSIRPFDNEYVQQEVSENIADIYQDLKDFVMLYQKEGYATKENAVFSCSYLFKNHWGKKVISLMKAMHFYLFDNDNL